MKWYIWSNDPGRMSLTLYNTLDEAENVAEVYKAMFPGFSWQVREY